MPYVSDGADWNLDMPTLWDVVRADRLYKPVAGVLPTGIVTDSSYNATAQTYTNPATLYWNSGVFNVQGQRWEGTADPTEGCKNVATTRTVSGVTPNHTLEFEFLHTGGNLDIIFIGSSYYDSQVYVEFGGKMWKVAATPLAGTTTGLMHRRLVFAAQFHGRIRVHLGGGLLVGVKCEQSAIIKKSEDRVFSVLEGGSWADGLGYKQASGTSWLCGRLADYLFERTGFVWAARAQPSGYFFNGDVAVFDDTPNNGLTRFFSAARKNLLETDFVGKPLFLLIVADLSDGGRSGATGGVSGPMAVRAKACYEWVRDKDRYVTIVQTSALPFTGAGAAGAATGPPTLGNPHDLNNVELAAARTDIQKSAFLNAYGPTNPWWSGAGSNDTPTASQQASLVGVDGVLPQAHGNSFLAGRLATELGQLSVNSLRGRRYR